MAAQVLPARTGAWSHSALTDVPEATDALAQIMRDVSGHQSTALSVGVVILRLMHRT